MSRPSVLAGKILPIIESFVLSRDDVHAIIEQVSAILSAVDLAVLFAFGWLLVPYARVVYSFVTRGEDSAKKKLDYKEENDEGGFEGSKLYIISDHLSQIARLAMLVYACDCVVVAFEAVGYKADVASKVFSKILFTR